MLTVPAMSVNIPSEEAIPEEDQKACLEPRLADFSDTRDEHLASRRYAETD